MTFDTWVSVCVSDWRGRVNYLCTNVPCQCSTRQIPCSILLMLHSMNLQERVVTVMLAVRESWLSSVTPRFLVFWVGVNTELSKLIVRSWVGEPFPGRKGSSVFSRLIFRWCADIHREMSVRQAEICAATCVSDWGKESTNKNSHFQSSLCYCVLFSSIYHHLFS